MADRPQRRLSEAARAARREQLRQHLRDEPNDVERVIAAMGDRRTRSLRNLRSLYEQWYIETNYRMTAAMKNVIYYLLGAFSDMEYGPEYFNNSAYQDRLVAAGGERLINFDGFISFSFGQPKVDERQTGKKEAVSITGRKLRKVNWVNLYIQSPDKADITMTIEGATYYGKRCGGDVPLGDIAIGVLPELFSALDDPRFSRSLEEECERVASRRRSREQATRERIQEVDLEDPGIDETTLDDCFQVVDELDLMTGGELTRAFELDETKVSSPWNWLYKNVASGDFNRYPQILEAWFRSHYTPNQATREDFAILRATIFEFRPEDPGRITNLLGDLEWMRKLKEEEKKHKVFELYKGKISTNIPFRRRQVLEFVEHDDTDQNGKQLTVQGLLDQGELSVATQCSIREQYTGYTTALKELNRHNSDRYLGKDKTFNERTGRLRTLKEDIDQAIETQRTAAEEAGAEFNKRRADISIIYGEYVLLRTFIEEGIDRTQLLARARTTTRQSGIENILMRNSDTFYSNAGVLIRKLELADAVQAMRATPPKRQAELLRCYAKVDILKTRYIAAIDFEAQEGVPVSPDDAPLSLNAVIYRIKHSLVRKGSTARSKMTVTDFNRLKDQDLRRIEYEAKHGLVARKYVKPTKDRPSKLTKAYNTVAGYLDTREKGSKTAEAVQYLRGLARDKNIRLDMSSCKITMDDLKGVRYVSQADSELLISMYDALREEHFKDIEPEKLTDGLKQTDGVVQELSEYQEKGYRVVNSTHGAVVSAKVQEYRFDQEKVQADVRVRGSILRFTSPKKLRDESKRLSEGYTPIQGLRR